MPTSLQDLATLAERNDAELVDTVYAAIADADPELAARLQDVFGDRGKAATWVVRPNSALGGLSPLRVLAQGDSETVRAVLGRIEHGIHG